MIRDLRKGDGCASAPSDRQRWLGGFAATVALCALVGCGEKEEPPPATTATTSATTTGAGATEAPRAERVGERGRSEGDPEEAIERTVSGYVQALDGGDGAALCRRLAPGALAGVELPRSGGSCATALGRSIGYRDPRGLPVFAGAALGGFVSVEVDGSEARATATVITRFADRDEPSVEDDVIYLVRRDDRWLVAKASSALYRAVGISDVPPQVLSPPR